MVSCRMPGWACCANWRTARAYQGRSPPRWPTPTAARGCMPPGRCSPIWRPQWPTGRTASTGSGNCAAIVSMCSARRRRRPRCGGWSMSGSTPHTCRRCGRHVLGRGRQRGAPEPPPHRVSGCTSTSMPRWSSITPTTRPALPRPGRRRSVFIRCWRFWIARRSPAGRPWPGCCAPATPAPTPPVTTSSSWNRHWPLCPRRGGPTPTIPATPTRPPVPGALRHRRSHPQIRRRLPHRRGWVLLRLPRRCPRTGRRGHPQPRPVLVSGDRHPRRHPRRRLGR